MFLQAEQMHKMTCKYFTQNGQYLALKCNSYIEKKKMLPDVFTPILRLFSWSKKQKTWKRGDLD